MIEVYIRLSFCLNYLSYDLHELSLIIASVTEKIAHLSVLLKLKKGSCLTDMMVAMNREMWRGILSCCANIDNEYCLRQVSLMRN